MHIRIEFSPVRSLVFVFAAAIYFALMVNTASATWQIGGQLASGSLSASPAYQSSAEAVGTSISKDGHYAVFISRSSTLSPSAPNGGVFRKNLWNDSAPLEVVATQPASVTHPNCGIPTLRSFVSLSYDGRFIAFATSQDGLVPADSNGRQDVYVRDMTQSIGAAGAFELASSPNGGNAAASYLLEDAGGGDVPVASNCLYGSELPGPNSLSSDGKRVIFTNTAYTSISATSGVTTAPGNLWARSLGGANSTELVTRVASDFDFSQPGLPSPTVTIGGPLPDQDYFNDDANTTLRTPVNAAISGDGSAVAWSGVFGRYQVPYHRSDGSAGDFQAQTHFYRRIADGSAAKTRRSFAWADLDDPNCDVNFTMNFLVDPEVSSPATYQKKLACIGPFASETPSQFATKAPVLTEDGRKVFALIGLPGHFLSSFLSDYPEDLVMTDMTPGVSRKNGTKWITRAVTNTDQPIDNFSVSSDGKRAAIETMRRTFSSTGLVQTGTFPASASTTAIFVIDGNLGSASGESGWSGAPIEWVARPTAGTTEPIPTAFGTPGISLDARGQRLAFTSRDPAYYAGANGQLQALCTSEEGSCSATPATTAPVVSIGGPANGALYGDSVTASYSALAATSVTCQWDSEAVLSPCPSSPLAAKTLSAGSHTFTVTGTNSAGSTTVVSTFTVGQAPTAPTINSPGPGATVASPVTPTYTTTGSPARVRCWYDSLNWVVTANGNTTTPGDFNCPASLPARTLTAGAHTFSVTASNDFGSATVVRSFTVGTPAPVVTITNLVENGVYANTISAQFTATNSPTSVQCKVDSGAYANCTSPRSLGVLSSGNGTTHTFGVKATNAGGTTEVIRTFTVVSNAPVATINSPANGAVGVPSPVSPTFTLTGGAAASVTCKWDSQPDITGCTPAALASTTLTAGSHTLTVTATNPIGSSVATSTFTVIEPPAVTIAGPTEGQVLGSPVTASFSLSGGAATSVSCQWDAESVISTCASPQGPKSLSTGAHQFKVTASNAAGSVTETRNFEVVAPPIATINTPANGAANVTSPVSPTFTLTGGPANSVVCKWDAQPDITNCTQAGLAGKVLTLGAHTLTVTATNPAGTSTATSSFTVIEAPTVTIATPTAGQVLGSPVTATFTLGGGAATSVSCQWDSESAVSSCASPQGPKSLTPGTHQFSVTATNAAGSVTATRSFEVVAAPTVTINSPADGASTVTSPVSPDFTLGGGAATSVSCQWDSETVITSCTEGSLASKSLTPGVHSLRISASNVAGTDEKTSTFTVLAAPTVLIDTPAAASTVVSPVNAQFTLGGGPATSVTCQWDSEPVINSCTSPLAAKALTPGSHSLTVVATGGGGSASVTRTFSVLAPPTVTIGSPANGATGVASPVSGSITLGGGPAASVTCQWDSEPLISSCTTASLAGKPFAAGSHSLSVTAQNAAGSATATHTFTVQQVIVDPCIATPCPVNHSVTPQKPKIGKSDATIPLVVTGAGMVTARGTAKLPRGKKFAVQVAGSGSVSITGDGTYALKFKLNGAAKKFLKKKRKLAVTVVITFTPSPASAPITKSVRLSFKAKK